MTTLLVFKMLVPYVLLGLALHTLVIGANRSSTEARPRLDQLLMCIAIISDGITLVSRRNCHRMYVMIAAGVLHATSRHGQLVGHRRKHQPLRDQHVHHDRDIRARARGTIAHRRESRSITNVIYA
jgi:hypothetical protein